MNLRIETVENRKNETVILAVLEDCNLKNYAIADNTFDKDRLSNRHQHVYFFPSEDVKKGDIVILHIGMKFKHSEPIAGTKNTKWHFYTGSEAEIWNNDGDTAYLIHYHSMQNKQVPAKRNLAVPKSFKRKE